jgi:hypothetical protein
VRGVDHRASVYSTYEEARSGNVTPIATGTVRVGDTIYADWDKVNRDPADPRHRMPDVGPLIAAG